MSNILPSVLLCRTLKPNGKLSGNLWFNKDREGIELLISGSVISVVWLFAFIWTVHSLPVTIGNFTNSCLPSMASKVIVTRMAF